MASISSSKARRVRAILNGLSTPAPPPIAVEDHANELAPPVPRAGSAVVATWRMDLVSRRVIGNAALGLFFGLPEGPVDCEARAFIAGIHPADVMRVIAAMEAAVHRDEPYDVVFRGLGRDRERTVRARGRVERDEQGKPAWQIGEAREQ